MKIGFEWLVILAVAPGLALAWWFYHKDKLDPEPLALVVRSFLTGALFVFPAALLEIFTSYLALLGPFIYQIIGVALIEEYMKWLALKRFINHQACDECYDGIVYGTSVALGFATLENLFYVLGSVNPFLVAGWRAFLSVPLHGLCGLFMGYEAARQKLSGGVKYNMIRILSLPVIAHGLFNYFLFLRSSSGVLLAIVLVVLFWLRAISLMKKSWSCNV